MEFTLAAISISSGKCGEFEKAPGGTGGDITHDSILLLDHAPGTLRTCGYISDTCVEESSIPEKRRV